MRNKCAALAFAWALPAFATIFGTVQGVIHDPSHRPVPGADVTLAAAKSEFTRSARTNDNGEFEFRAIPAGEYRIEVKQPGFSDATQAIRLTSGSTPVVHIQLRLAGQTQTVDVTETAGTVDQSVTTPTTLISREDIERTPGADLSNSLTMITDFVPGAYVTHDQLHLRGGHQVTWAIDGVPIPNTNIASNVGPQIDPKDIDYLEAQRGGYSAEYGDRIYGVFNVVPRSGFERNREFDIAATYGSFHQTNDQVSYGDHTERLAYFVSANGNYSDYGLQTPGPEVLHDSVWGLGGFGSLMFNKDASNQFRLATSLRRDNYQIPNDPEAQELGVRDTERERDAIVDFTWVRTLSPRVLWTLSPFYHYNRANYDGEGAPVSTVQQRASTYAGGQTAITATTREHNARAGVYAYGQLDNELIHLSTNDGSGRDVRQANSGTGSLVAAFLEDQYKPTQWLTITGGLRLTRFSGSLSENAADPRLGVAVRIPRLNWVARGFWGRYYQPPPLTTVSGPLLDLAVSEGLGFIPLAGERDQEYQAGLAIPLRGWTFDVNRFQLRARNYFDHNTLGNSNIFFPLTIDGALIKGWEVTARSPRIAKRAVVSVAYAYLLSQGQGAVTGGLTDFSPPESGYFLLDHDQRNTLHVNFNVSLPWRTWLSGDVYYGSGFTDGESETPAHLEPHTTFDVSLGKAIGERLSISLTALNAANRRYLLDNSETFGGTHYADPRSIYVQLRYRFRL
jgi:outer membrane receptor protein involved in Fe transport